MPYVQLDGLQYPLEPGDNSIGAGPSARVGLKGVGEQGIFAILELGEDGTVIVRRASGTPVLVNGTDIRDQPSPLIHGDKLEILGRELHFGDDRRIGSTSVLPRVAPRPAAPPPPGVRVSMPTATTGGRLVSLVDGREYLVPDAGLVIGRDPDCHVVIPSADVSRRHASIAPAEEGYLITDASSNGVIVNGAQVNGAQLLGRGDLVRIADEEFRFRVDAAPPSQKLYGTLEVRGTGVMSGQRFEVRSPVVRIGRGEHNDIALPDESVSDTHAMLQRRDNVGWCIVDQESTNGTYLSGRRVHGMAVIGDEADLRFASVKLIWRAEGAAAAEQEKSGRGTRVSAPTGPRAGTPRHVQAATPGVREQRSVEAGARGSVPPILWIMFAGLLGIVVFILLTTS